MDSLFFVCANIEVYLEWFLLHIDLFYAISSKQLNSDVSCNDNAQDFQALKQQLEEKEVATRRQDEIINTLRSIIVTSGDVKSSTPVAKVRNRISKNNTWLTCVHICLDVQG